METVPTCPLGHVCEEAKDGKLYVCRWFVEIEGSNPQTGEVIRKKDCAITQQVMVGIEAARTNRGQTQALESMRNENVNASNQLLGILNRAALEHETTD